MADENKQVVRRGFEEGFNAGDLAVFDELTDVDYIDYEAGDQSRRGPEEVKGVYRWLKAAFPDLRFDIVDMASEDDKVWTLVLFTGTHEGEFMGMQPTGRRFEARQVHMHRVRDGKTVEHRAVRDDLAMMQQLRGRRGRRILNRRSVWTALR